MVIDNALVGQIKARLDAIASARKEYVNQKQQYLAADCCSPLIPRADAVQREHERLEGLLKYILTEAGE